MMSPTDTLKRGHAQLLTFLRRCAMLMAVWSLLVPSSGCLPYTMCCCNSHVEAADEDATSWSTASMLGGRVTLDRSYHGGSATERLLNDAGSNDRQSKLGRSSRTLDAVSG